MSNDVVVPSADTVLGKCSRCGAEIKCDPVWYQFFMRVRAILNGL